jgi:hypothetical protein
MSGNEDMSSAERPKCPICIGTEFEEEGERSFQSLSCGHSGHEECLEGWIEQGHITCPTCRQPDLRIPITKNIRFPDLLALMMPVTTTTAAGWPGITDRNIAFDCAKAIAEKTEGHAGVYYSDHPPDGFDISQLLFMTLKEHRTDQSLCAQALRAFRALLENSMTDDPDFMLEPLCDAESDTYGEHPVGFMVALFEYHMNANAPLQSASVCEHLCYILGNIVQGVKEKESEGNDILRTANSARIAAGKRSLVGLLLACDDRHHEDSKTCANIWYFCEQLFRHEDNRDMLVEFVEHQGVERLFRDLAEHQADKHLCENICFAFYYLLATSMRVSDVGFMPRILSLTKVPLLLSVLEGYQESEGVVVAICHILQILPPDISLTNLPLLLSLLERHRESEGVVVAICGILQILPPDISLTNLPLLLSLLERHQKSEGVVVAICGILQILPPGRGLVELFVQLLQDYKRENEVYKNILLAFQRIVMPNPVMIGYLCDLFTSDAFWKHEKSLEERKELFDLKYFFVTFLIEFARIFKDGDEPLCHACIPALIRIDSERKPLYPAQFKFSEESPFKLAYDLFKNTPGHEADWTTYRTEFLHLLPEVATIAAATNRKSRRTYRKNRKASRKHRKASRKTR